jgi:hypothetical protein
MELIVVNQCRTEEIYEKIGSRRTRPAKITISIA